MIDELKPCPFCGSDDVYRIIGSEVLHCRHCGASGPWKIGYVWNSRYDDPICPQFGVIGAACSDPENMCDQYVFCKRARELQKTCLSSIDNITLMAESVRRGLATVEPDTLPQWAIEAIESMKNCTMKSLTYGDGWYDACDRILSLRKPEENK